MGYGPGCNANGLPAKRSAKNGTTSDLDPGLRMQSGCRGCGTAEVTTSTPSMTSSPYQLVAPEGQQYYFGATYLGPSAKLGTGDVTLDYYGSLPDGGAPGIPGIPDALKLLLLAAGPYTPYNSGPNLGYGVKVTYFPGRLYIDEFFVINQTESLIGWHYVYVVGPIGSHPRIRIGDAINAHTTASMNGPHIPFARTGSLQVSFDGACYGCNRINGDLIRSSWSVNLVVPSKP